MATTIKRTGFGQVEPNQLSAQKTGQIYASLPLDDKVKVLQNGEFMYYDYASGKVTADPKNAKAPGEPMLVFNEIKLYEPFWRTSYKDFAMIRVGDNYVTSKLATAGYGDSALTKGASITPSHTEYPYRMDGIAPRMLKTNIGDVYTTNMVETGVEYAVGDELQLKKVEHTGSDNVSTYNTLVLAKDAGDTVSTIKFVVAKVYTMPDGQPGLKLQRIA